MNIASVPWRCGQSCALVPAGRSRSRVAIACSTAGVSSALRPGCRASAASTTPRVSPEVRRAGDVRQDAAGRECVDRGIQQRGLQRVELGDIRRLLAPARLRTTAQGAEPGARRVEQDAVEPVRRPGREPQAVASQHLGRRIEHGQRVAHEPARAGTSSLATSVAPPSAASAASSAALPPGPAQRSSQRSPATIGRARLARARRAAIPRPAPARARSRRPELPAGSPPPIARRPASTPPGSPSSSTRGEAGQRGQAHRRRHVVGGEQRLELVAAPLGLERRGTRDDPDGMRVLEREPRIADRGRPAPARATPPASGA